MAKKKYILLGDDCCTILDDGEFEDLEQAQHYFEVDHGEGDTMFIAAVVSEFVPPSTGKWKKK